MKTLRIVNPSRQFIFNTKETLTHTSGATYSLTSINVAGITMRTTIVDRYGRDGGHATGDRQIAPRELRLSITVSHAGDDDNACRDCIDDLLTMFDEQCYLYDDQDDSANAPLRTRIELQSESIIADDGLLYKHHSGALNVTMIDALWETQQIFSRSATLSHDDSIEIVNNSRRIAYPVITVVPQNNNPLFRLTNIGTGAYVEIGSPDFRALDIMTISSIDGSIMLNDVDIAATSIGIGSTLLDLQPMNNQIKYSSAYGDADIEVEWRERWT